MTLNEYLEFTGIGTMENLSYLPQPNTADVVLTDLIAPLDIIPTSFCFPFLRDGRVVLANNRRRGAEVPGGHRDPINGILELPEIAARREALEEVGAVVQNITAIGFMRSSCQGEIPNGYRYPFPYSCQQFFAGFCEELLEYEENDECLAPLLVEPNDIELHLKGRGLLLYREAYRILFS